MPKVILYVPVSEFRALGEDVTRIRQVAKDAIRREADGGPGDTHNGSSDTGTPLPVRTQADRGVASPPGASAPARQFRGPDLKPSERKR